MGTSEQEAYHLLECVSIPVPTSGWEPLMQNAITGAWDGACVYMGGGTHINRSDRGQMAAGPGSGEAARQLHFQV